MNRFKKEIRKRGWMLEMDYDCLPSDEGIECVSCDAEEALIAQYHISAGWHTWYIGRDMEPVFDVDLVPQMIIDKYLRCRI